MDVPTFPKVTDPTLSDQEVALRVHRLRLLDRLSVVPYLLSLVMGFWLATEVYHRRGLPSLFYGILLPLLASLIATFFLNYQCPRCGKRLIPSGRTRQGTLDAPACENCGASFVVAPKVRTDR